MNPDEEHLRLLTIFHYVVGGLTALFACFPLIHLAFGIAIVNGMFPVQAHGEAPPPFIGWILVFVAATLIFIGWMLAIAILVSGRFLARRRHYLFCMIVGGVECLVMPFGTVLGVFTIIVLMRPQVKALFDLDRPL